MIYKMVFIETFESAEMSELIITEHNETAEIDFI